MRRTHPWLLLSLLGLALATPTVAQDPESEGEREDCVCFDTGTHDLLSRFSVRADRPRIGVYLGDAVEVDGHTGVRIMEVVGDGPAEAAGLREGDIITAADGTELGDDPADALIEIIGDHEAGDTIRIVYYRDGDPSTAEVRTDTGGFGVVSPRGFQLRSAPGGQMRQLFTPGGEIQIANPRAGILRRLAPGGLELTELNAGLGEYFGTDEGVLVLDAMEDELGLLPGDVILAIDGREVTDAAHVRAILASYRADETVTFEVVRHEREIEVTGTVR